MKFINMLVAALAVQLSCWAGFPEPIARWSGQLLANGQVENQVTTGPTLTIGTGVRVVDDPVMGKVLAFDGTRDGWAKTTGKLVGFNARTFACWIRREATIPLSDNAYPHLIGAWSGINCSWYKAEDLMRFALSSPVSGTDDNIYSKIPVSFAAEGWHFVVWTLSPIEGNTYEVAGYLDGVLVGSKQTLTFSSSIDYTGNPHTVYFGNNFEGNNRGFYGQIKDLTLYDCALTQNQQIKLWLDVKATLPKETFGYWPLETIEGEAGDGKKRSTPDLSGNGFQLDCGGSGIDLVPGISGKCFAITAPYDSAKSGNVSYGYMSFQAKGKVLGPYTVSFWLKRDQFVQAASGPRVFMDYTDPILQVQVRGLEDNTLNVSYNSTARYTTQDAIKRPGEWSHLTMVFDTEYDADTDTYKGKNTIYMNGVEVPSAPELVYTKSHFPIKDGRFIFGNNNLVPAQGTRGFPGCLDEIRMIEGALTAEEVKSLYRGASRVDAGEDFAVTGEMAVLRGAVAEASAQFGLVNGYAGEVAWKLVSAPEGVETVTFARAANPVCEVLLPELGEYVFRLQTTAVGGLVASDEVTVTRRAVAMESVPSVTAPDVEPSRVEKSGVAALSATVSAGARISWSKVSGPGVVWFQPETAEQTAASFSAEGTYVLRCTAETDAGRACADVTVEVQSAFVGGVVDGLLTNWAFEGDLKDGVQSTVGEVLGDSASTFRYVPGAAGSTIGNATARNDYFNTKIRMPDGSDVFEANAEPGEDERYRTLTAWIYIDSADPNLTRTAYIFYQDYNLILAYRTDLYETEEDRGTFWVGQASAKNEEQGISNGGFYTMAFRGPVADIKDRWVHVALVLDRKNYEKTAGKGAKLYVDGERLAYKPEKGWWGFTLNARMNDNKISVGGCKDVVSRRGTTDGWESEEISRRFPGLIDEFRIYDRELSLGEILFLKANPLKGNFAPQVGEVELGAGVAAKVTTPLSACSGDDGILQTIEYTWEIVRGDPEQVAIADCHALQTTVRIAVPGIYAFRLKAFDGERTTYGEVKEITVNEPGLTIIFR